jgi:hypothetical protein
MLRSVASPLEWKQKHWIDIIAIDHPPQTVLTPTLHYYKKVISTLVTHLITQPYLYFASSLVRAPRHQSSTHRRHMPIVPPHNDTHGDELADFLLFFKQLIGM